jgi:hypothetical protein
VTGDILRHARHLNRMREGFGRHAVLVRINHYIPA